MYGAPHGRDVWRATLSLALALALALSLALSRSRSQHTLTRSSKAPGAYLSRPVYQHSAPLPSTLQARMSFWRETGTQSDVRAREASRRPSEERAREKRKARTPPLRACARARSAQASRAAPAHDPSRGLHVHSRRALGLPIGCKQLCTRSCSNKHTQTTAVETGFFFLFSTHTKLCIYFVNWTAQTIKISGRRPGGDLPLWFLKKHSLSLTKVKMICF